MLLWGPETLADLRHLNTFATFLMTSKKIVKNYDELVRITLIEVGIN